MFSESCSHARCVVSTSGVPTGGGSNPRMYVVLTAGEYRGGLRAVEGEECSNADGRSTDG